MCSETDISRNIDLDDKGYVDKQTVVKAVQDAGENASYDQIRETLKECGVDASGRVELDDYVEVRRRRQILREFS